MAVPHLTVPSRLRSQCGQIPGNAPPARTLHSCTGHSVPWQQQLVRNVSVRGWEKNDQPGRPKGHGMGRGQHG